MYLYVVRHGQSEANLIRAHSGQDVLVKLTQKGLEDAAKAGKRLEGISFDLVYSSDQKRAIQTAKTALPEYAPIYDKRIREIDVGSLNGCLIDDCKKKYGQLYDDVVANRAFSYFGGENLVNQYNRVVDFMKMLEALSGRENVAVFTHAGVIHCMIQYTLDIPVSKKIFSIENGSVTVFSYKDGVWRMCLT